MEKEINYDFYYWGPFLWHTKLPDKLCDDIEEKFSYSTSDHTDLVASLIENVKRIDNYDTRVWFGNIIEPYFKAYLDLRKDYHNDHTEKKLVMDYIWINYQQKHESNPEHMHKGDISFVIYLNIPQSIYEENKKYVGKSPGPGGIYFTYGETSTWAVNYKSFLPKKGDMFVFPAQLRHGVIPFSSEGKRISVSGNFMYE